MRSLKKSLLGSAMMSLRHNFKNDTFYVLASLPFFVVFYLSYFFVLEYSQIRPSFAIHVNVIHCAFLKEKSVDKVHNRSFYYLFLWTLGKSACRCGCEVNSHVLWEHCGTWEWYWTQLVLPHSCDRRCLTVFVAPKVGRGEQRSVQLARHTSLYE